MDQTPPSPPPPIAPPPPLAARVFACELPCVHCAYDLRTIPLADRCPECGKPAADSLDALALAEPSDLARIRVGLLLLFGAGFGVPLLAFLIVIGTLFASNMGKSEGAIAYLVGTLMLVVGPVMSRCGCGQLTPPIRRQFIRDLPPTPPPGPGPIISIVASAHLALCILFGIMLMMLSSSRRDEEPFALASATLACLALLAWDARNFFLCRTFAALCARANLAGTRHIFQFLSGAAIGFAGAHALMGLAALTLYLFPRIIEDAFSNGPGNSSFGLLYIVFGTITTIIQFASLAWFFLWSIMLVLFNRRLIRAQSLARAAQKEILAEPKHTDAAFLSVEPVQRQNPHVPLPLS